MHPSIRNVAKVFFCSAEPAKKPHIKLQKYLAPMEIMETNINLGIGIYRLRIKGNTQTGSLSITDAESANRVNWSKFICADNEYR